MSTFEIRSLLAWPYPNVTERLSSATFRAPFDDTVALLREEARCLAARGPIVLQLVCQPTDIRRDGMLRARAIVGHPGVIVTLTVPDRGPLVFATDTYVATYAAAMPGWQANVRAIGLGLRALRAVDRYGITRRGEQYAGFRELESAASGFASAEDALRWIHHVADADPRWKPQRAYRAAARALHPDAGGTREQWNRLERARDLLTREGYL